MSSTSRTSTILRGLIAASLIGIVAVALGLGQTIAALSSPKWAPDPDIGLTDAERQAAHAEMSREFWAHYVTWLGEQDHGGLREYPVEDLLATVGGPQATLSDAVNKAAVIVAGRVDSVDFRVAPDGPNVMPVTAIRVTVDRVIKGSPGSMIEIMIPCLLMPSPEWEPTLNCVDAVPMLYPGDAAVLVLNMRSTDQTLGIQPWTGLYWLRAGKVKSVAGNPFGPEVESMTAKQFEAALANLRR